MRLHGRLCYNAPSAGIPRCSMKRVRLSIGSWAYCFGPYKDNPVPFDTVIDKLSETMLVVMNDPAIAKQFSDQQLTVMALPKEKFGELIKADTEKWRKVVTDANI